MQHCKSARDGAWRRLQAATPRGENLATTKRHADYVKKQRRAEAKRALRQWRSVELDADEHFNVVRHNSTVGSLPGNGRGIPRHQPVSERACSERLEKELRRFIMHWKGLYGAHHNPHSANCHQEAHHSASENRGFEQQNETSASGRHFQGHTEADSRRGGPFSNHFDSNSRGEWKSYERNGNSFGGRSSSESAWRDREDGSKEHCSRAFHEQNREPRGWHASTGGDQQARGSSGDRFRRADEKKRGSSPDGRESFSMSGASHRKLLGLPIAGTLTSACVKHAFRTCALLWHPDRHIGPGKVIAEAKFKAASVAYEALLRSCST